MYGRVFIHFWCHISVANVRMDEDQSGKTWDNGRTHIFIFCLTEKLLCYAMLCYAMMKRLRYPKYVLSLGHTWQQQWKLLIVWTHLMLFSASNKVICFYFQILYVLQKKIRMRSNIYCWHMCSLCYCYILCVSAYIFSTNTTITQRTFCIKTYLQIFLIMKHH